MSCVSCQCTWPMTRTAHGIIAWSGDMEAGAAVQPPHAVGFMCLAPLLHHELGT